MLMESTCCGAMLLHKTSGIVCMLNEHVSPALLMLIVSGYAATSSYT